MDAAAHASRSLAMLRGEREDMTEARLRVV